MDLKMSLENKVQHGQADHLAVKRDTLYEEVADVHKLKSKMQVLA